MSSHPRPFYYLENFSDALTCLLSRYGDLLSKDEHDFIERFSTLPREASALLARLIGRRGRLFRMSKLQYDEIGCPQRAAIPLVEAGWIDPRPLLSSADLGRLLTKAELRSLVRTSAESKGRLKGELLELLERTHEEPRPLDEWWPSLADRVYHVLIRPLCDRLRILFFGNFRQQWSEFVLADLGIFRYERVPIDAMSRAFRSRAEIDQFDALYRCRELIEERASSERVLAAMPDALPECGWLEVRRARLLFLIGQQFEKSHQFDQALAVYRHCSHPEARTRTIRVLERVGRVQEALALLEAAQGEPASELEAQRLARIAARLHRKVGRAVQRRRIARSWATFELELPQPQFEVRVEQLAAEHLSAATAPVLYVENALVNTLLGLLCWPAIFTPIKGAFFHDFHAAPADLFDPDFLRRRQDEFSACLAQLESGHYRRTILQTFEHKAGIASPFVAWGAVTREHLMLALRCIPACHLRAYLERVLSDIRSNRSGLPDLIQFWPEEERYRLIEVKGPGDRLQDNQIRWLTYCTEHGMPVAVCKVNWQQLT